MAKTRVQKADAIAGLEDRFGRTTGVVFADFTGVKVRELEELRQRCRAVGCEVLIVKKSLFRRAAEARGFPTDVALSVGGLSVLFGFQDPIAPAKVVKEFIRAHAAMRILGGTLRAEEGMRSLDVAAVTAIGDLPSREELHARAVGSIAAPIRGFVGVLQGNLRNLVGVLHAIVQAQSS